MKEALIASIVWAFIVWYGGEVMSMLMTGQAGVLSGAPGAVLLYPLLGFAIYSRKRSETATRQGNATALNEGLLSRTQLRWVLSGFWFFAALLQLQPNWWQPGQISQAIGAMTGQGGLNAVLVDPVLQQISNITANMEIPLNIALIVVFLALGFGLAVVRQAQLRPFLIASIVVCVVIWYCSEAFGMILTGMATDFNSGQLVVVMALACWPKAQTLRFARDARQVEKSGTTL